jgi:hypothetical protein
LHLKFEHVIKNAAQSEYKKRHDIFAKIIHMNLAVKFNLLKDTQPHYIYKPESCLEKISILPLIISATGIVPQSLFKNFKILDLDIGS